MDAHCIAAKERLDSVDLNALIDKALKSYGRAETGRMMAIEALLTEGGINKLDNEREIFAHMDFEYLALKAESLQVYRFYGSDDQESRAIDLTRTLARAGAIVLNRILTVAGNVVDERIAETGGHGDG